MILIAPLLFALLPQALEDPGSHPAGWRSFSYTDAATGRHEYGRIYYPALASGRDAPADPAAGPYPVVAFQHGWLGSPSDYDSLCLHLASWGYLVPSTGTETGLFPDTHQYAADTKSILHWVEASSADPLSWLSGMAAPGDWSAIGHSMGGGTLSLLIAIEPRVSTIIGLQAAAADASGNGAMASFPGAVFMIAGSVDRIVRPATVHHWTDLADPTQGGNSRRDLYWEIQGMGHLGPTDTPPTNERMAAGEQSRVHRRLLTGILEAELRGREECYLDLLGEGVDFPADRESVCAEPILWAAPSLATLGTVDFGLASIPATLGLRAASFVPASIPTAYGTLGLSPGDLLILDQSPLPAQGWIETSFPSRPTWSGRIAFFQALGRQRLTRTASLALP